MKLSVNTTNLESDDTSSRDTDASPKLFVSGLGDATEEALHELFSKYGEVEKATLKRDHLTGQSRGFGFVSFRDPSILDKVLSEDCILGTRKIECKLALPRRLTADWGGRRLFVGGLSPYITGKDLKDYFSEFGTVVSAVVKMDDTTKKSRGFGFVVFTKPEPVTTLLQREHRIGGRHIQCKLAIPRHEMEASKLAAASDQQSDSSNEDETNTTASSFQQNGYPQTYAPMYSYPVYFPQTYGGVYPQMYPPAMQTAKHTQSEHFFQQSPHMAAQSPQMAAQSPQMTAAAAPAVPPVPAAPDTQDSRQEVVDGRQQPQFQPAQYQQVPQYAMSPSMTGYAPSVQPYVLYPQPSYSYVPATQPSYMASPQASYTASPQMMYLPAQQPYTMPTLWV
jgi:RNA recognition motif-containing protein